MRRRLAAGLVLVALTGCGLGAGTSEPVGGGTVLVFAASSLTDAFGEAAELFERRNPGLRVTYNLAGSQQLARQILDGAPADVFAAADSAQMDEVATAGGLAGRPRTFATNVLAVAVEPGNPLGIDGLADLAEPGVTLVMAGEEVPAGRYAREALRTAGVDAVPASLEPDVRAVLSRVALGEADAGIVYRSDLLAAAGEVDGVAIPAEHNVTAVYPIAVLDDAPNAEAAAAFVAFVTSAEGQAILAEHGLAGP